MRLRTANRRRRQATETGGPRWEARLRRWAGSTYSALDRMAIDLVNLPLAGFIMTPSEARASVGLSPLFEPIPFVIAEGEFTLYEAWINGEIAKVFR